MDLLTDRLDNCGVEQCNQHWYEARDGRIVLDGPLLVDEADLPLAGQLLFHE